MGMFEEFPDIMPHQGFPSRKKDNGDLEQREVVKEFYPFHRSEFVRVFPVFRVGITMATVEVTPPGYVPDNHWFALFRG
jgi:hypothetical protein